MRKDDPIAPIKAFVEAGQRAQEAVLVEELRYAIKQLMEVNNLLQHRILVLETENRGLYAKLEISAVPETCPGGAGE